MSCQPHILCIDGYNFLRRACAGFTAGDYYVPFNTFRNLRALVEAHAPSRVYFVTEGHPKWRYELMPDYKANRRLVEVASGQTDDVDPRVLEHLERERSFYRQASLTVDLLSKHFPVSVVRHPDHECDDTVFNLIKRSSAAVPWTVCSNDSDFVQLLGQFPHVRLFNPMAKEYVEDPGFDYVTWKSLRGDGTDNIPGIPGVGDKTAEELVNDPDKLKAFFRDPSIAEQFSRNFKLISFKEWTDTEAAQMESSAPTRNWDAVQDAFLQWEFRSLLKDKTWAKFRATFDSLFGEP